MQAASRAGARGALGRGAAASGRMAATNASPAGVQGTSTILRSPEHVVALKRRQLQDLRPSFGPATVGMYAARVLSVPLYIADRVLRVLPQSQTRQDAGGMTSQQEPFPVEHEWVTVNGIRLHCASPGRQRERPLMLMLHGYPECWYSWRHQMAAFADEYDVVAVDMRGYNDSDKPQRVNDYTTEVLASDVAALVKALGHEKCTLVAHDWGGLVAWLVAGTYGSSLVDRLVVMSCPHLGVMLTNFTPEQYKRSAYMLFFTLPLWPEHVMVRGDAHGFVNFMFKESPTGLKHGTMTDADLDVYREAALKPGAATAMLNYYRALMPRLAWGADAESPMYKALRTTIDVPTLVLHGDSDTAFGPAMLSGIEAAAPRSTVHVLKDCSHWLQQDWPELTTALMKEWLETP